MTIIDINFMIGRWPKEKLKFWSVEDLVKKMDYYHIDKAVVYSSMARKHSPVEGNIHLMNLIGNYHDRLIPSWVALPTWDIETGNRFIDDLKSNKVKLVRVFSKEHNYILDDWVCGSLFKDLELHYIPLLLDGEDVHSTEIHNICKNYPNLPVILTRPEYTNNRNIYKLFSLHSNFYLEISTYLVYGGIEDVVSRFGASRLIFGSHMPFQEGGAALTMVNYAEITAKERKMIFHQNFERILEGVKL